MNRASSLRTLRYFRHGEERSLKREDEVKRPLCLLQFRILFYLRVGHAMVIGYILFTSSCQSFTVSSLHPGLLRTRHNGSYFNYLHLLPRIVASLKAGQRDHVFSQEAQFLTGVTKLIPAHI